MAEFDWSKYEVQPEKDFDWEQYEVKPEHIGPQESTGLSGVATDAISGLLRSALSIPGALYHLPGEVMGVGKQLYLNPQRAAQNIGGGFGELGHEILSTPGNIRDYLVKKQLASQHSPSFRLPESILPQEYNYAESLGRKGQEAGDTLLESLPGMAAAAPFETKLLSALKEVPFTKKMAAKPYKQAAQLAQEREISDIKLPKKLLTEAKDFLPKNAASRDLLKKAASGDYNAIHTLQSDLGGISRELTRYFSTGSDRLRGIDAGKLRGAINSEFKSQLEKTGHEDIAALRQKGQKKYRTHMKYRKPVGYAALALAASHLPGFSLGHKLLGLVD